MSLLRSGDGKQSKARIEQGTINNRINNRKHDYEYTGIRIFPWHFSAILLITAITLLISSGIGSFNPKFIFPLLLFWFLTVIGWMNFLFRRLIVTKDGIIYKRTLNVNFRVIYTSDWYFLFNNIEKIKVRKNVIRLKFKKKTGSPSLIIVKDVEGFVKVVQKYAPDKLEVSK
jgi:hypothetical protein